jgi:hypothetical protein
VVAATDRSNGKRPGPEHNNRFEQLLEKPCPHHEGEVKHKLKGCKLMKRFLAGRASSSGRKGGPKPPLEQAKGDDFPKTDVCLMIFGSPTAVEGRRQPKIIARAVHAVEHAVPQYLQWSEEAITFDQKDHPSVIPHPG